jgi:hypothetical protein
MSTQPVETCDRDHEEVARLGTVVGLPSKEICLGCLPIRLDTVRKAASISLALNLDHLDNSTHRSRLQETPPIILFYHFVSLNKDNCLLCRWIHFEAEHGVAQKEGHLYVFTSAELEGRISSIRTFGSPLLPRCEPIIKLNCHAEIGK